MMCYGNSPLLKSVVISFHEDQTPTVMTNRPALKGYHENQTKSEGHEMRDGLSGYVIQGRTLLFWNI